MCCPGRGQIGTTSNLQLDEAADELTGGFAAQAFLGLTCMTASQPALEPGQRTNLCLSPGPSTTIPRTPGSGSQRVRFLIRVRCEPQTPGSRFNIAKQAKSRLTSLAARITDFFTLSRPHLLSPTLQSGSARSALCRGEIKKDQREQTHRLGRQWSKSTQPRINLSRPVHLQTAPAGRQIYFQSLQQVAPHARRREPFNKRAAQTHRERLWRTVLRTR